VGITAYRQQELILTSLLGRFPLSALNTKFYFSVGITDYRQQDLTLTASLGRFPLSALHATSYFSL